MNTYILIFNLLKIYEDIFDGKLFQTISCYKPRSLTTFQNGTETVLAFLQGDVVVRVSDEKIYLFFFILLLLLLVLKPYMMLFNKCISRFKRFFSCFHFSFFLSLYLIFSFLQAFVYRGIQGFVELTAFKLPSFAISMKHNRIVVNSQISFACPQNYLVIALDDELWFIKAVTIGECKISSKPKC